MTSGAMLGLALIIYSVIIVFLDYTSFSYLTISFLNFLYLIILIIGVVWGTKKYRDKVLDGKISYSNALVAGTTIVFFAAIICAFFSYIFNQFIDPAYAERSAKAVSEKIIPFLQEHRFPTDYIDTITEQLKTKTLPTPAESAIGLIPFSTLIGLMISLITSIFIKKNNNTATYNR